MTVKFVQEGAESEFQVSLTESLYFSGKTGHFCWSVASFQKLVVLLVFEFLFSKLVSIVP